MCVANYNSKGRSAAAPRKGALLPDRYKAVPAVTEKRSLEYKVVDTETGKCKHVYNCFLWAEKKAKELNRAEERKNDSRK